VRTLKRGYRIQTAVYTRRTKINSAHSREEVVMPSKQSSLPEVEILMTGLAFGESPRWHEGRLWFCNWGAQEVIAVDLEGKSDVVVRVPTTLPFCIDWLPDGRLLVVSGREGILLRREPDGTLVTHADLRDLSDKSWNEIVVDGRGNAYVNCSGFDLMAGEKFKPGMIDLVNPDGSAPKEGDDNGLHDCMVEA